MAVKLSGAFNKAILVCKRLANCAASGAAKIRLAAKLSFSGCAICSSVAAGVVGLMTPSRTPFSPNSTGFNTSLPTGAGELSNALVCSGFSTLQLMLESASSCNVLGCAAGFIAGVTFAKDAASNAASIFFKLLFASVSSVEACEAAFTFKPSIVVEASVANVETTGVLATSPSVSGSETGGVGLA